MATKHDLDVFHPAYAVYVYAQNQVSVMSEQLTTLNDRTIRGHRHEGRGPLHAQLAAEF